MTRVDTSDEGRAVAHGPESQGCLLIVAAYAEVAQVLRPVATEAGARIMMSPMLGDFIELRFVDLGPRPRRRAELAAAVARIADELTRPGNNTAQNYFALVVADNSAMTIEQMFSACGANPIVAALPLRSRGLAALDDREPSAVSAETPTAIAHVIVPSAGAWGRRELIDELRGYAEDLLHDFATGHEPGLTRAELGSIRSSDEEIVLAGPAVPAALAGDDAEPGPQPSAPPPRTPGPQQQAPLAEASSAPSPKSSSPMPSSARSPRQGLRWHRRLRRSRPTELMGELNRFPEPRQLPDRATEPDRPAEPVPAPDRPAEPDRAAELVHGSARSPEPLAGEPAVDAAGKVPIAALVLLILSGDDNSGGRATWNRGRSLLIEVDEKLATASQAVFTVRALVSKEDAAKSTLRRAGNLSRRDMKRPASLVDFACLLAAARTAMKRDLDTLTRSGMSTARPAVVLFAAEAPLADAITARVYQGLVQEASVIWVVPERSADLMSPVFAVASTSIVADHQAVAEEVIDLLRVNAGIVPPSGSAEIGPPLYSRVQVRRRFRAMKLKFPEHSGKPRRGW